MAEQTQAEAIRAGMIRWQAYVEDFHIDQWATERQELFDSLQADWQGHAQPLALSPEGSNYLGEVEEWTRVLHSVNEAREGEDVAISPGAHLTYYAWAAERDADPGDIPPEWEDDFQVEPSRAEGMERDYETQYTGILGHAPERIEIDTSDHDMGGKWTEQLAALDARLDKLTRETQTHEQAQTMDREWW
jgi:hypothetical protein